MSAVTTAAIAFSLLKAKINTSTYVPANTNLFGEWYTLNPKAVSSVFSIYIVTDTAGSINVQRAKNSNGGSAVTEKLFGGNTLAANAAYEFGFRVDVGEYINFQYSVNANILTLKLYEFDVQTMK